MHQQAKAEVHFIVKKKFSAVIEQNPYISKVFTFEKEIDEIIDSLKVESYDYIIDLHNNLRSNYLSHKLGIIAHKFEKLNYKKWLLVNLKINRLPQKHIIERYFDAIPIPNIKYDGKGLDYFIEEKDRQAFQNLPSEYGNGYNVFVVGGAHFTKQIPTEHLIKLVSLSPKPVVLLGGPDDISKAEIIENELKNKVWNAVGKLTLNQSAAIISQCETVITADTGLMHIAAAFDRKIHSFWGNTVPEFGMTPFFPEGSTTSSKIHQVENLSCRPCSKIGFNKCPKKHFKCMNQIDFTQVF